MIFCTWTAHEIKIEKKIYRAHEKRIPHLSADDTVAAVEILGVHVHRAAFSFGASVTTT